MFIPRRTGVDSGFSWANSYTAGNPRGGATPPRDSTPQRGGLFSVVWGSMSECSNRKCWWLHPAPGWILENLGVDCLVGQFSAAGEAGYPMQGVWGKSKAELSKAELSNATLLI